ncbi:hypothetical protein D3C73_1498450 [compost metagenome]
MVLQAFALDMAQQLIHLLAQLIAALGRQQDRAGDHRGVGGHDLIVLGDQQVSVGPTGTERR